MYHHYVWIFTVHIMVHYWNFFHIQRRSCRLLEELQWHISCFRQNAGRIIAPLCPPIRDLALTTTQHSLGRNLEMCRVPFYCYSSFPRVNRLFSSLFASLALHSFFICLFSSISLTSLWFSSYLPSFFAFSQTKLDISFCFLLIGRRLISQSECFPRLLISGCDLLHFGILIITALPIESRPHLRQNCVVTVFVVHRPSHASCLNFSVEILCRFSKLCRP